MNRRKLGNSSLEVSVVGLGCNNFGMRIELDESRKVIDKAIDLGITLFDTADIYGKRGGSESILGQVLGERRKKILEASQRSLTNQLITVTLRSPQAVAERPSTEAWRPPPRRSRCAIGSRRVRARRSSELRRGAARPSRR